MPRSRRRREQKGYALLAVIVVMAMMTAAVVLAHQESVDTLKTAGGIRASEMIKSGMEHGLDRAIVEVQSLDEGTLADPPPEWNLFGGAVPATTPNPFLLPVTYPQDGPYQDQYRVRFGLRPGQRARAPAGEDASQAYGQIVEVQLGIEAAAAGIPPAEERVSVGILIPRAGAYASY